jgi:ketosteroid isomerase-like protein
LIRRLFDGFNKREFLPELWTADAEWRPAFLGGGLVEGAVYRGHEGIAEFLELQAETWETALADPVEIRDLGDQLLVKVHLEAVGRASAIPVERITWNVFEMREGKIAAGCVYTNEGEAVEAVGLHES